MLKKQGGPTKGRLNNHTIEAKALARQLVNDPTYRQHLLQRLQTGEAGAMESPFCENVRYSLQHVNLTIPGQGVGRTMAVS
jgi:hypothetical protein